MNSPEESALDQAARNALSRIENGVLQAQRHTGCPNQCAVCALRASLPAGRMVAVRRGVERWRDGEFDSRLWKHSRE